MKLPELLQFSAKPGFFCLQRCVFFKFGLKKLKNLNEKLRKKAVNIFLLKGYKSILSLCKANCKFNVTALAIIEALIL